MVILTCEKFSGNVAGSNSKLIFDIPLLIKSIENSLGAEDKKRLFVFIKP
jgi:hypothetical protein